MNNWIANAVFYQIYPLGFCGCEQFHQEQITHRILKLKEWIPHLKRLHINAVYLGPVFESYEHGYDTSDYRKLDNRLGTNEDFREVCRALHEAGIRIVLDGVFNHVGRCFHAFCNVQKNREASPYCGWFSNLSFHGASPMGDPFTYDTWQGHYNLVKLNLRNEEVVRYLLDSVGMWIREFDIDGLRLDAADCVDPAFFKRLKQFCQAKKEDFWLMGEIIHGDYNRWANPDMLDSVTNYECYKGLYSSHNEKNYFEIGYSLNRQFGTGGIYCSLLLYNFVDNHDVNRIASVIKEQKDLYNVYTMLYTMPGIPSLYYGSEAGVPGVKGYGSDAALRPRLELEQIEKANPSLLAHLQRLGEIKTACPALWSGGYEQILLKNEQFIFCRRWKEEVFYAAFNTADHEATLSFPCQKSVLYDLLQQTTKSSTHGEIVLTLPAKQACLLYSQPLDDENSYVEEEQKPTAEQQAAAEEKQKNAAEKQEEAPSLPESLTLPLGRYEHFKGKHYSVLYVAKHSESGEPYVVYRQLYGDEQVWVRPLSMFSEQVEVNGSVVPRFRFIGD